MLSEIVINSIPLAPIIVGVVALLLLPIGLLQASPQTYRRMWAQLESLRGLDELGRWYYKPLVWFLAKPVRASCIVRTGILTGSLVAYTAAFVSAPTKYIAIAGFLVCIPLGGWMYYALISPARAMDESERGPDARR